MSENQTPKEMSEEQISEEPTAEQITDELVRSGDIGIILVASEVQYIDIQNEFNLVKKPNGWIITIGDKDTKVVFNLKSMRKIEKNLHPGDMVEKENDDIIIVQKLTEEEKEQGGPVRRPHARSYQRKVSEETTRDE
ncbi:hypothetical protein FJZ31_17150 [Candidatus Poribacteria bacterium]|nr:hypothetical protein [Candidatus Poribacteria bacterium]